jgi:hypothetical protein
LSPLVYSEQIRSEVSALWVGEVDGMVARCGSKLADDGDVATEETRGLCEIAVEETFLMAHSRATSASQEKTTRPNKRHDIVVEMDVSDQKTETDRQRDRGRETEGPVRGGQGEGGKRYTLPLSLWKGLHGGGELWWVTDDQIIR